MKASSCCGRVLRDSGSDECGADEEGICEMHFESR